MSADDSTSLELVGDSKRGRRRGAKGRVKPGANDESETRGSKEALLSDSEAQVGLPELKDNADGRGLFEPKSKYSDKLRKEQKWEGVYLGGMLLVTLAALGLVGIGAIVPDGLPGTVSRPAQRFILVALGGLLGGLVYGGKWLYHSIAKGLWHQDRRMWRILSPWISLGATIGIWSLMNAGFFPPVSESPSGSTSLTTFVGIGFVIGYLSDRFLAKMKELTEVLFGRSDSRFRAETDKSRKGR